jgi:DNA-binding SARP family transcriptional activator
VEFRILGPLEVVEAGEPVALGTVKERLVLGVLLLHANEFVSRERLIDDLWGEAPPPTSNKAVNVYLSKVRKALRRAGADPIATASGGYRLQVAPDELDADRMQLLVASARECASKGEFESAAERFRGALSLWRGPTLAGLQLESRGRDEVAQLDELRLAALMDRIDCDLALGRHEQALGELNLLVREHPLRERLRGQQMLALYRADRQADALEAYGEARRTLVDDLGIEPSEGLQRLQQAILRHDPSLETPEGTAAVNGLAPPEIAPPEIAPPPTPGGDAELGEGRTRGRFRPRRWQLALAALVILAAAASVAAILASSSGATPHVVSNSLVRLDPRNGKIVSVTRVGVEPGPIAVTPTAIWTVNLGARTVSRYDLRTHSVDPKGGFPIRPYGIAADHDGNVWVSSEASIITRIARGSGGTSAGPLYFSHTKVIRLPRPGAGSLALGGGYLWVIVGPLTYPGDNRITQVSLSSGELVRSWQLKGDTVSIAFGDGAAWVGTNYAGVGLLNVIRPGAQRPESVRLGNGDLTVPLAISAGEGGVWVLTWGTNGGVGVGSPQALLELDPDTLQVVKRIPFYGRALWSVAAGGGSVWVIAGAVDAVQAGGGSYDDSVIQLDPRSGRIIRTIPVGSSSSKHTNLCGIAATNDAVWVSVGDAGCDTNAQ